MPARAKPVHGEGVWSQNPLLVNEIFEQLMWCVQVHYHAAEISSCFDENSVWHVKLFAAVIPSLPNSIGHLWFFLLEQVPREWFRLNQITLLFRHCVCKHPCAWMCLWIFLLMYMCRLVDMGQVCIV